MLRFWYARVLVPVEFETKVCFVAKPCWVARFEFSTSDLFEFLLELSFCSTVGPGVQQTDVSELHFLQFDGRFNPKAQGELRVLVV
jgi:hypothetical protein